MFVEEEVVSCRVFGDSHRQVSQFCRLSAAQPDQLLFGVYLLWTEEIKLLISQLVLDAPCFKLHAEGNNSLSEPKARLSFR